MPLLQGGPLPVTNGAITPISKGYKPSYPFIWPFNKSPITPFITI